MNGAACTFVSELTHRLRVSCILSDAHPLEMAEVRPVFPVGLVELYSVEGVSDFRSCAILGETSDRTRYCVCVTDTISREISDYLASGPGRGICDDMHHRIQ